jgi:hypothetical protein
LYGNPHPVLDAVVIPTRRNFLTAREPEHGNPHPVLDAVVIRL